MRVAKPEKITGMADALRSPAYSTSVGLLRLYFANGNRHARADRQQRLGCRSEHRQLTHWLLPPPAA
ncbi:MAG: hypothetical protein U0703_10915 [Anaerolineae bacterium]